MRKGCSVDFDNAVFPALLAAVLALVMSGCSSLQAQKQENLVLKKIRQKNEVWSYCYKSALRKDQTEDLEGELGMSWQIDYLLGQERVSQVSVEKSTLRSESLVNCMKTAITKMRFDLPREEGKAVYKVSHPFVFKSDKEKSILNR